MSFWHYFMSCLSSDFKRKVPCIAIVFAFGLWDISAAQWVNHCRPRDCYDLQCNGVSTGTDGPHTIYPRGQRTPVPMEVSCEQETDGGGWIMYQRRVDGTLNFTKTWDEYKDGFGHNGGNMTELWLGNENVYQLIQSYQNMWVTLRIEIDTFRGVSHWIEVSDFKLGNELLRYSILFQNGDASESGVLTRWNEHKRHTFKTFDNDDGATNCLDTYKGGWWYSLRCGQTLLNGIYRGTPPPVSIGGYMWLYAGTIKPGLLERTRMMFRPDMHRCDNPCQNGATCEHLVYDTGQPRGHRCVCPFEYCGYACQSDNPCKNGGSCEYFETTKNTTCICTAEFMGLECEDPVPTTPTPPPSNTTTPTNITMPPTNITTTPPSNTTTPSASNTTAPSNTTTTPPSNTTMPPPSNITTPHPSNTTTPSNTTMPSTTAPTTTAPTTIMPIVGGILLLLILIGLAIAIAAGVIHQRRQTTEYEEEELEGNDERLRVVERREIVSCQDYMLGIFGF